MNKLVLGPEVLREKDSALNELHTRFSIGQLVDAVAHYGYGNGEEFFDWLVQNGADDDGAQDTVDALRHALAHKIPVPMIEYMLLRGPWLHAESQTASPVAEQGLSSAVIEDASRIPKSGFSLGRHAEVPSPSYIAGVLRALCRPMLPTYGITAQEVSDAVWYNVIRIEPAQ